MPQTLDYILRRTTPDRGGFILSIDLLNQGCHLEYPNPIMIMLTTSMPLPRVMVLSVVARQVIKEPMPIMIVPSIADSL